MLILHLNLFKGLVVVIIDLRVKVFIIASLASM